MKIKTTAKLAAAILGLSLLTAPAFAGNGRGDDDRGRGDRNYSCSEGRSHNCNDRARTGRHRDGERHSSNERHHGRGDHHWQGRDRRGGDRDGHRNRGRHHSDHDRRDRRHGGRGHD